MDTDVSPLFVFALVEILTVGSRGPSTTATPQ